MDRRLRSVFWVIFAVLALATGFSMFETFATGALVALGLTLQYGVARIMNLSYGETLVAASFAAMALYTGAAVNPLVGLLVVALIYLLLTILTLNKRLSKEDQTYLIPRGSGSSQARSND